MYEIWLWENYFSLHRGIEPASVLRLAFKSYALPTDLSRSSTLCSVVSFPCVHHIDQQEASRMSVTFFSCVSVVLETCLTFIDHSCQLVASRRSRASENENQSVRVLETQMCLVNVTSGLYFGKSEVLRSLKRNLGTQNRGHHDTQRWYVRERCRKRPKSMTSSKARKDQHWNCLKGSIWQQQQQTTTATTTTSPRKEMKRMKNDGLCRVHRYHFRLKRTKLSSELSQWGLAVVCPCGIDHFVEERFCSGERGHPSVHSYWWSYYFEGGTITRHAGQRLGGRQWLHVTSDRPQSPSYNAS